jgi:hypothetical protein
MSSTQTVASQPPPDPLDLPSEGAPEEGASRQINHQIVVWYVSPNGDCEAIPLGCLCEDRINNGRLLPMNSLFARANPFRHGSVEWNNFDKNQARIADEYRESIVTLFFYK